VYRELQVAKAFKVQQYKEYKDKQVLHKEQQVARAFKVFKV
jgi:hypothetical protein